MTTDSDLSTKQGLPELGVRRPWLVLVLNLLIAICGIAALLAIEVRELPDVDRPVVSVNAFLPGASPETMDAEVTRLLEGAAEPGDVRGRSAAAPSVGRSAAARHARPPPNGGG